MTEMKPAHYTCLACGMVGPQRICERCRSGETPAEEVRTGYIRITCRGDRAFNGAQHAKRCEGAKVLPKRRAETRLRTFDPGSSTYICDHCHGLVVLRKRTPGALRILRRRADVDDIGGRVVSTPRSRKELNALHLAVARTSGRWSTGDVAHLRVRSTPSSPPSPATVYARVAGFWRKPGGPKVVLGLCRWCGTITMQAAADVDRDIGPLEYHAQCWREHLATREGAEWMRRRAKGLTNDALRDIVPGDLLPRLPEDRSRGTRWPNLRRDFTWAVRHLLGGDEQLALAKEITPPLPRSVVSEAITKVVNHLPPPGLSSRRLDGYATALREARARARAA